MSASRDATADAQNAQPAPLLSPLSYNDGDIVIRSSDKTVFKLHKIVLSLASQVFRDMLSLDQAATFTATPENPLPVVDISESSQTFDGIVRLIYPVSPPDLTSMDFIADLL
ncbi:hypothetical protein SISNIDRAFT_456104, partial [Sistotremastrum niveocremeum HHB9708]